MSRMFIDVREPDEYAGSHVEGALNLPLAELQKGEPDELKDVPRDTEMVTYCMAGGRAEQGAELLRGMGFTNVTNGINQQEVEKKYFS